MRDLYGQYTGTSSDVTNEGDVTNALVGCGVFNVETNSERARLLWILLNVTSAF